MRRRTSHLKRVLLIATNFQAANVCKRLSDSANVLCRSVATVEEAEAVMENRPPHVVILDFKLGGENGLKYVKYLLTATAPRKIPLILITDNAANWQTQNLEEIGVYGTLISPFKLTDLSLMVIEAAKKTERSTSSGEMMSLR